MQASDLRVGRANSISGIAWKFDRVSPGQDRDSGPIRWGLCSAIAAVKRELPDPPYAVSPMDVQGSYIERVSVCMCGCYYDGEMAV